MGEKKDSYRCPRCKDENIIDFDDIIECTSCKLEFYKKSIDVFGEEGILSIQELEGIAEVLGINEKNKTPLKKKKSSQEKKA